MKLKLIKKLRTPKIIGALVLVCALAITPACRQSTVVPVGPVVKDSVQASIAKKNQEVVGGIGLGNDIAKSLVNNGILVDADLVTARAYMVKAVQVSQTISRIQLAKPVDWQAQIKAAIQGLQTIEPKFANDPKYANIAAAVQLIANSYKAILAMVQTGKPLAFVCIGTDAHGVYETGPCTASTDLVGHVRYQPSTMLVEEGN